MINGRTLRDLAAGGLLGLAVFAVGLGVFVAAGGSLRLEWSGMRVSVRSPWTAFVVGLVALAASGLASRRRDEARPWCTSAWWRRWCAAMAAVCTAGVIAIGAVFGHADATGADASGYLSQAALWTSGRLRVEQPLVAEALWPDAAWTLSPLGYRPGPDPRTIVPTYPPGLPLQFALAQMLGGQRALRLVVPALGGLAVWCAFVIGRRVAGHAGGLVAAALVATSPSFLYQVVQPMSDVPTTAWWLAALALLLSAAPARHALAGLASGVALLTRPNLAPLLLVGWAMARWCPQRPNRSEASGAQPARAAWIYALGALPALLFLAGVNTHLYGAPWRSGYGTTAELFSLRHVQANLRLYTAWLVETHLPLVALTLAGLVLLAVERRHARSSRSPADEGWPPPMRDRQPLVVWLIVFALIVLGVYLLYAPFESWTYLRFLLPATAAAASIAALGAMHLIGWLPGRARVPALVGVLAVAGGLAVATAHDRGAFRLARDEGRYRTIAEWVRHHTSDDTVVLAAQHSGSIRHMANRVVLRWDLLDPGATQSIAASPASDAGKAAQGSAGDEPAAVAAWPAPPHTWLEVAWSGAWMARPGGIARPAVLVLDAEEEEIFRRRFGQHSTVGRLDWPPWAMTDPPLSVRVYRLEDRAAYLSGRAVVPARVARAPLP